MQSDKVKVFKDSVHGYINIPEAYVRAFIDTDLFQRLRNIEQTGMRILFPSARHDRFIHSLGVYHLGHKAFKCFEKSVKAGYPDSHYLIKTDEKENILFWRECRLLFEAACLLHDCGHAPFSHTFEYAYFLEPDDSIELTEKLKSKIESDGFRSDYSGEGDAHEVMSALLVCTEYSQAIESLLKEDAGDDTPLFSIQEAVEFIARMIIGFAYRETDPAHQIQNCLIKLLNSSSIDVDSLDYIIRDSRMSGVQTMGIDVDRLLQSLTLVEVTKFTNAALNDCAIDTIVINGDLCSRDGKAAVFSGRFKGNTVLDGAGTNVNLIQGAVSAEGTMKVNSDCRLVSASYMEKRVEISGTEFKKLNETEKNVAIKFKGLLDGELSLNGEKLIFYPETDSQGSISSPDIRFTAVSLSGKVSGCFSGEILGNQKELAPSQSSLILELGFKKSSLSVIQNVIVARNYEYQWTFSHHKVVYHANYLVIELLRQCIRFILGRNQKPLHASDEIQKILSWKTMITPSESEKECGPYDLYGLKFWRPTDADFLNLFNYCYMESEDSDEVRKYLIEFRTRRFKKSLWKSYAEMRIFFDRFTNNEIQQIKKMLVDYSTNTKEDGSADGYRFNEQYGYPNRVFSQKLYQCGLDQVVWVSGSSKLKALDPVSTYIHFKDRDMTYGSVSMPNDIRPMSNNPDLFYLYYTPAEGTEINIPGLQRLFRESLEAWKKQGAER